MSFRKSNLKVGVYADVSNMYLNGGHKMQYDILREFAIRDGGELIRLNAYVSFDPKRAKEDADYRDGAKEFYSSLRDYGYKVITKEVKSFRDKETNEVFKKANADLDLAVDVLLQSENLDKILICTGDGDFIQVVQAIQNRGIRLEIVALDNSSYELRHEADIFVSGFLIPNLIPTKTSRKPNALSWGEVGSRVRGVCYWYDKEKGYGFFKYLDKIKGGLWQTDTRNPDSPYKTAYFHASNFTNDSYISSLPSREFIFEFDLVSSGKNDGLQATNIDLVSKL